MPGQTDTVRDGIFISYRRDDARGASGRLYDWLRIAFGRDKVFHDVASIGPGKWREKIDAVLSRSVVCLPVIGTRWCDDTNGPRLAQEGDMMRHELVSSLAQSADGLILILTLVEDARVPPRKKLPANLHDLLEWNAYPLREAGWEDDMRRLLAAVSDCSGQPVAGDVDTLLACAQEAETRMRQLEQERHLQSDQIRALTDSIHALPRQLAEAPTADRADLGAALAALAKGDTAAEAEFERVLVERSAVARAAMDQAAAASRQAAEAARHIASLAMLDDVKALRYYQRAAELDPEDTWTWFFIGDLHRSAGDLAAALASYQRAGGLIERRLADDPDKPEGQRDLSVSFERIGDVLVAQGDRPGALAAYRKSLAIAEALAARARPTRNGSGT